jgi:hypothetical protein
MKMKQNNNVLRKINLFLIIFSHKTVYVIIPISINNILFKVETMYVHQFLVSHTVINDLNFNKISLYTSKIDNKYKTKFTLFEIPRN